MIFCSNTFENPVSGISFQYPSTWQPSSEGYSKLLTENTKNYMENKGVIDNTKVVADMFPKSLSGAFLTIISEKLPFPMSSKNYLKTNQALFDKMGIQIKDITPFSLDNIDGYKYNATTSDGFTQTQVLFTQDSNGFVINYYLGQVDQLKDNDAIKLMLNSFKIK